jgi:hypothetical protein
VTFVLSALTQHEVAQLSDRRFTYTRPGKQPTYDDEQNKAVLFCGRLLLSFCGVGDIGMGRETDTWLAERICEVIAEAGAAVDQGVLLTGIASKATEQFRKMRYRGRRHAFIGVGWARSNPPDPEAPAQPNEFQPYLVLVSNFHDNGRQLPKAETEFSIWGRVLQPNEAGFVFDVPNHLSQEEADRLVAALAAADQARDVEGILNVMGSKIREVAARDDGVGEGLMINCLPRAALAAGPGHLYLAGRPLADTQTFLYVPPSGDTAVQLGPVTTCGGGITKNFRAEPLPANAPPIPRPGPTLPDDPPGLVRRWYLTRIVLVDSPFGTAHQAETLGRGGAAVFPPQDEGQHAYSEDDEALVLVSSDDHEPLVADPRIYPIADLVDLDRQVAELDDTKRAWIEAVAKYRQVSSDGSVREVVRRLGQQFQPGFDESQHWVR